MKNKRPTLQEAKAQFSVHKLDAGCLEGQEEAYARCLEFLHEIELIKSFNRNHTSYGLKHIVENPSGRFDTPSDPSAYACYVYEGTFILAALASGLRMEQSPNGLKAVFNISERSLKRRAREVAAARIQAKSA